MKFPIRIGARAATAALLVTLMATSALPSSYAHASGLLGIPAPSATQVTDENGVVTNTGLLVQRDEEGGFYQAGDYALMGDEKLFASLVGKAVIVKGTEFDGATITMVKTLEVSEIAAAPETADPVVVSAPDLKLTLEGIVTFSDLEGGFYTVDGWGLIGDEVLFKALVGRQVTVHGAEFTGMSTRMVKQVEVERITESLTAKRPLPETVKFGTRMVSFDQKPVIIDGVLMLPLRAVAEAAGGRVEWDARERMITVTMPDRMAWFWIAQGEAEMSENNVRYIRRNLLPMSKAPLIQNGRTLISADAATAILGLAEKADGDASLDLVNSK